MALRFDLTPAKPLAPADAVAAIVCTADGRYLLQRRDATPTIFYPDHWGCFGGAIEKGESPKEALHRELREELAFDIGGTPVSLFGHFRFSVEAAGILPLDRYYYELRIDADAVKHMRLGEGASMELVDAHRALHELNLVPYDGFALWLHRHRGMLSRAG